MKITLEPDLNALAQIKIPRAVLIAAFSRIITELNSDSIILERIQDRHFDIRVRVRPEGVDKEYSLSVILDYLGTILK